MGGLYSLASRFGPPLLLMAVIYLVSDQPDLSTGLGGIDTVLRKIAHMVEYGLLWFLWWRALNYGWPVPAVLIALLYAASDEWHQTMVRGRSGQPTDWLIDAAGVGLAGLMVIWWARRRGANHDRPGLRGDVRGEHEERAPR